MCKIVCFVFVLFCVSISSVTRCMEMFILLQGFLRRQLGVLQFSSVLTLTNVNNDSIIRGLGLKSSLLCCKCQLPEQGCHPPLPQVKDPTTSHILYFARITSEHRRTFQWDLLRQRIWQRTHTQASAETQRYMGRGFKSPCQAGFLWHAQHPDSPNPSSWIFIESSPLGDDQSASPCQRWGAGWMSQIS